VFDVVSTWLFRGLARIAARLSWKRAQSLGAILGIAWLRLVRIRRRVVGRNLAEALPERRAEHPAIERECYRHLGISALELLRTRAMPPEEVAARVHPRGMEHFEAARGRGLGVIVVTAHFGNFDLLACSQALIGHPLAIVSRVLRAGRSNRFWMETRSASGLEIIPEDRAARGSLSWLRAGKVLGLVVDQRTPADRGGIPVPFMGRPAWTSTAAARLALRTGAPLLPVRIERRDDGDHDLVVEPEIPTDGCCGEEGVREITARVNRIVESWVRGRPGHWMWLHRRWAGAPIPAGDPGLGTRREMDEGAETGLNRGLESQVARRYTPGVRGSGCAARD